MLQGLMNKLMGGDAIRYKCPNCKIKLETDNDNSGSIDVCPSCNEPHLAPLSKQDKAIERAAIRESAREIQAKHRADVLSKEAAVFAASRYEKLVAARSEEAKRQREGHNRRFCLTIKCPHCQGTFRAEKLSKNEHWICPKCGGTFGGGSGSGSSGLLTGVLLGGMLFGD